MSPSKKNPASSSQKKGGQTYAYNLQFSFASTVFRVKKFTTKDFKGIKTPKIGLFPIQRNLLLKKGDANG